MKHFKLRRIVFFALCCDLGLFTKRLIAPLANILTNFLHIPGGIGTSYSLLFLVLAAVLLPGFGCATLMGAVQSVLAFSMGMVGSMGVFAPIGYIGPAFVIDCALLLCRKLRIDEEFTLLTSNMLASAAACLIANALVFRLRGLVLLLYLSVALTSGAVCGLFGGLIAPRLRPFIYEPSERKKYEN